MNIGKPLSGMLESLIAYVTALLILPFFLLPGTVWAELGPISHLPLLKYGGFTEENALLISMATVAVWLTYHTQVRHGAASWVWFSLLFYLGSHMAACFHVPSRVSMILNATQVLITLSSGLLVVRLCRSPQRAAAVLTILGTAQAAYAIYGYTHGHSTFVSGVMTRASGTLGNPLFLATMMYICIPLCISLAIEEKRYCIGAAWGLSGIVMFAALLLSGSRGAILAMTIGLIWMIWRLSKRWTAVLGVSVVLATLCLYSTVRRTSGDINQASTERSTRGHYILAQRGLAVFRNNWATGVGAGSLRILAPVRKGNKVTEEVYQEPKNLMVHWLAELGVGGGLLFVFFFVGIGQVIRHSSGPSALGIGAAWIALLFAGLFDTPFGLVSRPHANALVGALVGATLLLPSGEPLKEVSDPPDQARIVEKDSQIS